MTQDEREVTGRREDPEPRRSDPIELHEHPEDGPASQHERRGVTVSLKRFGLRVAEEPGEAGEGTGSPAEDP